MLIIVMAALLLLLLMHLAPNPSPLATAARLTRSRGL